MNREELYEEYGNQYPLIMGFREVTYEDWLQKQVIDLRTNKPLPPAEGADPKKVQWSGYGPLGNISQKPLQPTAEGAEEYLRKHPFILGETEDGEDYLSTEDIELIKQLAPMLEEFATLHAQRIAEKMKEANQFILDIAGVLGIETDGVGFDGLTLSIDDFKEAAEKMVSERLRGMTERCKKLEFMIENGLGWEDMRNDITMPHEL